MVQITARCNLRCRMCQVWTLEHADPFELPVSDYRAMAQVFQEAGIQVVTLAGEPFLRDDLPEIVGAFSQAGASVRVQTNGTLMDEERLRAALSAGLAGVSISLHSLDPEKMDWVANRPDTLEAVLAGIEVVRSLTADRPDFLRILNVVVSGLNLEEIPALLDFAADRDFRLSIIPMHTSSVREDERQFVARVHDRFQLQPSDHQRLRQLIERLRRERRRGRHLLNSSRYLGMVPSHFQGASSPWTCLAGTLYVFVDHRGQVAGCHELDPVGSILDPDVGRSLAAGDLGWSAASDRARCSGCLLPCWTELSLMFSDPIAMLEAVEVNLGRVLPGGGRRP